MRGTGFTGTRVLVLHSAAESPPTKAWLLRSTLLHARISFGADIFKRRLVLFAKHKRKCLIFKEH